MHVNQLAKMLMTTPDTVRFYTRIGFLRPTKNARNSYKCYDGDDRRRLHFILCARQLGFSVEEVGTLLTQSEAGSEYCPQVMEILQQRLDEVQFLLAHTLSLKDRLRKALEEWRQQPGRAPTGNMLDLLIRDFAEH